MKVRLGYVASALRLEDCSPSKTVTLRNINKIDGHENQISRLISISKENLSNTLRILKANFFDKIYVYRFTSKLIPLCTHPQFQDWDYIQDLKEEFKLIGEYVKENKMRVSLHPDHFTLLNSPKPEVLKASIRDLDYHIKVLDAMGLLNKAKMIIHVGGKYSDKDSALCRFKDQLAFLPLAIKNSLALENDDRCFSTIEVLKLCKEVSLPMVLDIHHHEILNHGEKITELLSDIFTTWCNDIPKVHISSPRDEKNPRNHADYIEINTVIKFLKLTKDIYNQDFDIMLEAKQKDLALFKVSKDLEKNGFNLPNKGEIII